MSLILYLKQKEERKRKNLSSAAVFDKFVPSSRRIKNRILSERQKQEVPYPYALESDSYNNLDTYQLFLLISAHSLY